MRVADLRVGDGVVVMLGARERAARVTGFRSYGRALTWVTVDITRGPTNVHVHPRAVLRRVSRRFSSSRGSGRADAQTRSDQ